MAIGLIQPMGLFVVLELLHLPKEYFQWLMAANGIGMIAGGGLTMGLSKKIPPLGMLVIGMAVSAVTIAGTGLSTILWLTLALQLLSGFVMPMIQIGINTTILKDTEQEFVGRVNGILNPCFMGAMVVTMSLGVLKQSFSLVLLYEAAALFFVAGALVVIPFIRKRVEEKPVPGS